MKDLLYYNYYASSIDPIIISFDNNNCFNLSSACFLKKTALCDKGSKVYILIVSVIREL